jgi:hypothetical protein
MYPKYFGSINKRYSTNIYSRAGRIIALSPDFDWVA